MKTESQFNLSDVEHVWFDDWKMDRTFRPLAGVPYCVHGSVGGGDEETVNVIFIPAEDGCDDVCDLCPLQGTKRCALTKCGGLRGLTFLVDPDGELATETGEPLEADAAKCGVWNNEIRETALEELGATLAALKTPEAISAAYDNWLELNQEFGETYQFKDRADEIVRIRRSEIGPNRKKRGRPRKTAEPAAPIGANETNAPVESGAPIERADAGVEKTESRREKWEDALLELDKAARKAEAEAERAKENAREAGARARKIRKKINEILSAGSENYNGETPLFDGIEEPAPGEGVDAREMKDFYESLKK